MGDDEQSGRSSTTVHDEQVAKARALLLRQPYLSLRIMAEEELVHRIRRIRPWYPGKGTIFFWGGGGGVKGTFKNKNVIV